MTSLTHSIPPRLNLDPPTAIIIHSGKRTRMDPESFRGRWPSEWEIGFCAVPRFHEHHEGKNHMKLTTSLIGIAALGFITSAFAQEEETASPAPEEKPSTTIEETPAATPEAKTTATPAERPAAQKKEKPAVPAPGKTTSTAAAAPAKKTSVEATLKDLENKWEAAIAAHDASFLQSAVASDFVGIYSNGKFINNSGLISAEIKSDTNTYASTKNEKLNVRVFKPNVAVVTGNAREKGTAKDGKTFD
jgi:type IV secretory pathway VirB10-like protein